MTRILCLGLGYSARPIARCLAARGWGVVGTSTTAGGAARISALGYEGLVFDGAAGAAEVRRRLSEATHVLVSIPPDASGDPALAVLSEAVRAAPQLRWVGYLSTVGVYGDRQGGWVDENSELRPGSTRSRRRVTAEQAWLALAEPGRRSVEVFRLAGIYGPGRSAIDSVRAGTARRIIKPGQVFNRIHVEDIARTVIAAIDRPGLFSVYNVSDDEPAPPEDVISYAARLIGVPVPPDIPFAEAELDPMALSFYAECKRVSNQRIRRDLGVALAYPTYREGLAALASD